MSVVSRRVALAAPLTIAAVPAAASTSDAELIRLCLSYHEAYRYRLTVGDDDDSEAE